MQRLIIVSELYYPEETSTGYFLTGIAEGLAACGSFAVHVLTAQPTYSRRGLRAPVKERRHGVEIRRCGGTRLDKNKLINRLVNLFTISFFLAVHALFSLRRGDIVLVVTNPPLVPFLVAVASRIRGANPVLLVHDVYPDVLVPTGILKKSNLLYRILDWVQARVLLQFSRILVLGRDMRALIAGKDPRLEERLEVTPNWTELSEVSFVPRSGNVLRKRLGLEDKFVVQFSGNLGRTHGIEELLSTARLVEGEDIHFLVYGWGASRRLIENALERGEVKNLTLLDPCARSELSVYLNACDVFLMIFKAGMSGISVPSRIYNVLAAGNPIIVSCDEDSEVAQIVQESQIGWFVPAGSPERLAAALREVVKRRADLAEMRLRARTTAESQYSREVVLKRYRDVLESV